MKKLIFGGLIVLNASVLAARLEHPVTCEWEAERAMPCNEERERVSIKLRPIKDSTFNRIELSFFSHTPQQCFAQEFSVNARGKFTFHRTNQETGARTGRISFKQIMTDGDQYSFQSVPDVNQLTFPEGPQEGEFDIQLIQAYANYDFENLSLQNSRIRTLKCRRTF